MKQPRSTELGFTLVELAVVIAVTGMMGVILVPKLHSAKMKAQQTACLNNLNQIGVAAMQYCKDNRDTFPSKKVMGNRGKFINTRYSWVGGKGAPSPSDRPQFEHLDATRRPLNRYLGEFTATSEVPVARCPGDAGTNYTYAGASYLANMHPDVAAKTILLDTDANSCKTSQIKYPSRMVILGDMGIYESAYAGRTARSELFVHTKVGDPRWNMVFADGHVAFVEMAVTPGTPVWYTNSYSFNREH